MTYMTIGQAITAAMESTRTTQGELALRLGTDQGTVSRWCNDSPRYNPRPHQIADIERALGLPLGSVLSAAGLVQTVSSVPAAIAADLTLASEDRETLLALWRTCSERGHNFDSRQ